MKRSCRKREGVGRRCADGRSGAFLIMTALLVALIGILFGIGRLALYRYQCQIRFDRQSEVDRILATRSALRWLETTPELPSDEKSKLYIGSNGQVYTVIIRPVEPIYKTEWPVDEWSGKVEQGEGRVRYVESADHGPLELHPGTNLTDRAAVYYDLPDYETWHNATNAPFGRRYWLKPKEIIVPEGVESDKNIILSLYLFSVDPGSPDRRTDPDLEGDPWIRVTLDYTSDLGNEGQMYMSYWTGSSDDSIFSFDAQGWDFVQHGFGVQLGMKEARLFEVYERFEHKQQWSIPDEFLDQFQSMRIYIEARPGNEERQETPLYMDHFTVDQPYEYEVILSWERNQKQYEEIATVVYARPRVDEWDIITYDTHGTSAGGR